MAKVQFVVFLLLDGCLLERQFLSTLQNSQGRYGTTRIRKKAARLPEEPVPSISLSR